MTTQAVHIRKRAGRSLASPGYSHRHHLMFADGYVDPTGQTLCGAKATTYDESWADTRWEKNRAFVTCEACNAIRTGGS